jgi:ABC-type transporter Mla subunit MlaD
MEPITATIVLSYALPKLLDASLAKLSESLTEGTLSRIKTLGTQLLQTIRSRFLNRPDAMKVLTAAEQGSERDLSNLEKYLQEVLEQEPAFVEELQPIVQEIEQTIQIEAPSAKNIQQISGGQGLQVNDPQAPVVQASGNNNTFNF